MKTFLLLITILFSALPGGSAWAQATAWIQVEAHDNLTEAQGRARDYASAFPNVAGFRMRSGWYAIALGPYSEDEAALVLDRFLSDRQVPTDSYIAFAADYGQPFWPVGGPQAAATAEPAAVAAVVPAIAEQPDESPAEARRSEAALDRGQREDLQRALQWFGYYGSAIDGAFGPGTRGSMSAWQTAKGHEPTGILTTRQRAELVDTWLGEVAELGLERVREDEAAIEIDLPMAMLRFDRYEPPFVHYAEANGSGIRALLISQRGDEATLSGLYDAMQTLEIVPLEGFREKDSRSFTLTGRNAELASHTEVRQAGGMVKGFTLIWTPRAEAAKVDRILTAMQASFTPFGDRALDSSLALLDDSLRTEMLAGLEVRRPDSTQSGFFIDAAGTVLTAAAGLDACGRITVGDDHPADIVLRDTAIGIAVLRPRDAMSPIGHAAFRDGEPQVASEVAVAGYSYGDALDLPVLTFGALTGLQGLNGESGVRRLALEVLPGDTGGPVFDANGAVLGVLLPREDAGNRVLPADVSFAADAPAIAARLPVDGLGISMSAAEQGMAPEDLALLAADMTVLVACWK